MKNLLKNGIQSRVFCMFIVLALISLLLMGCPTPPDPDTDPTKSSNATLSSITIKGKAAGMGTPSAIMDNVIAGTVTIKESDEGVTTGALSDSKAVLTKIVKFPANETSTFAAAFASKAPYNNEAVANGDFFVFLVTAEDGNTKLHYRVDVTVAAFVYPLTDANVSGASDSSKVAFFVSDTLLEQVFYNTMTYAQVVKLLGNPVTAINDSHAGDYLYAGEFTGAASGTLKKAGVHATPLAEEAPAATIVIELKDTVAPPPPPSAAINGTVYIEAIMNNGDGEDGEEADASIIIELDNATANAEALAQVEDAANWFSPSVDGLEYSVNSESINIITITVTGMPEETSTDESIITIPVGMILDGKGNANVAPLEVNGDSIYYDIYQAETPDRPTDILFTPLENLILGNISNDASPSDYDMTNMEGYVIGNFSASGGTPGYSFSLISGNGDTDNEKFTIVATWGAPQLQTAEALTEEKTYSIRVEVKDTFDETFVEVITFSIAYLPASGTPSASIENSPIDISGTIANEDGDFAEGIVSYPQSIYITLGDHVRVKELPVNTDVSSWFNNADSGLSYTLQNAVNPWVSTINILVGISAENPPTAPIIADGITISIPSDVLLDSNLNPTITEELDVDGEINVNITMALPTAAKIGERKFSSLHDAVFSARAEDTIIIVNNIELSETVDLYGKSGDVAIQAERDGLVISPAEDFTGPLFKVSFVNNNNTTLVLGNSDIENTPHSPTLIIDGKNQVNRLIEVNDRNTVNMYNGVELRNAAECALSLRGATTGYNQVNANMYGGVIASSRLGVNVGALGYLVIYGGIIYGSDGGENANEESIYIPTQNPTTYNGYAAIDGEFDPLTVATHYTQTFGTAP
jgi:hypothetical protein